ncbi:MAG: cytochrome P450, partial [Pseudomonadota bacterium]|nr:cytochrome P450 [Pseudomonadota bacterium]
MLNALKNCFLGDLPEFSKDPLGFVERIAAGQKKPVVFQLGGRCTTLISRPSGIRHVLLDKRERYTKGAEQKKMRSLMGEGLITSNGDRWQDARNAMRTTFTAANLTKGLELALATMMNEVALLAGQTDREIDLKPLLGRMTIRMAAAALFHERFDIRTSEMVYEACLVAHHRLTNSMMSLVDISMFFPTREKREYQKAVSDIEGVIAELVRNPKGLLKDVLPLVGIYGADVLRDESITMLIAGFETTATAACWLVYALAENPHLADWI